MTADAPVRTEDIVPVKSRVSWGAVGAGAVLALALYFLLTLLGGATGLSVSDKVTASALKTGAAVFAILVTLVCLFTGGYVASRLTVGEDKAEGVMYGILVWAATFAMLMALLAGGVRSGFSAVVGLASAGQATADRTTQDDWEEAARRAGVPQDRIEEWKQKAKDTPANVKAAVEKPENQRAAADAATRASWYAFFGAWLSMVAAAAGGYVGAGPTLRLVTVRTAPVVRV